MQPKQVGHTMTNERPSSGAGRRAAVFLLLATVGVGGVALLEAERRSSDELVSSQARAPVERVARAGAMAERSTHEEGKVGMKAEGGKVGGLGSRGTGLGGGGSANGLGGLATKGRGSGASGYGKGAVSLGTKGHSGSVFGGGSVASQAPGTAVVSSETALTLTSEDPLSTFAADVDTGSYTFARRLLRAGSLPQASTVRVEEFVNFFKYDYRQPRGDEPLAVDAELVPHPTKVGRHVLRVGVQAKKVEKADRKPVRLTFLVDTSGSMRGRDRLGLAQKAMKHTLHGLGDEDTVAIVTYAGSTQVVLPPTPATQRVAIRRGIEDLAAGGGTAMNSGMALAYEQAEASYAEGAENRVVVLSDGDANIGRTGVDDMLKTIRRHAEGGITLTTVGFGTGNYQDARMEQLADAGDGAYVYIDGLEEALRVFGRDLGATLESVARDVKLQVDFDPAVVKGWRQVGYVNRQIADQDFRNDAVDAGEVGSGHQVTALYEVELTPNWQLTSKLGRVNLRAKPPGPDRPAKEWSEGLPTSLFRGLEDASPDTRMALAAMHLADALHDRDGAALDRADALARRLEADGRRGADEVLELSRAARGLLGPGGATEQGAVPGDVVKQVFRRNAKQLKYCYERELTKVPGLAGEMEVKFVIAASGYVSRSTVVASTMGNAAVERCVEQRVLRMRFPEPEGGGVAVVQYPLVFKPS